MTCLYCGKKLGFFSRYKDTPFCSEEHLRTHQDELEQALMERLGSKSTLPSKSLSSLANMQSPPLQSMLGVEAATRNTQPRLEALANTYPKPTKAITAPPIESKPEPIKAVQPSTPPPLHEDYLFKLPNALPALDISTPLIPPSSFAIIVQADCCTPISPDPSLNLQFPLDLTEFEIDTASLLRSVTFASPAKPALFNEEGFGEPWVELPNLPNFEAEIDFDLTNGFQPLEYEAETSTISHTALGQRDEIIPRLRLRFPYAASEVSSLWSTLPSTDKTFTVSEATDWDPILPAATFSPQVDEPVAEAAKVAPHFDVPLSIGALAKFNLDAADSEDFGNSLSVIAKALSATAGISSDCTAGTWKSHVALPAGKTLKIQQTQWQPQRSSNRVPPMPFPSLFQLGPVLPPRPESSAGQ